MASEVYEIIKQGLRDKNLTEEEHMRFTVEFTNEIIWRIHSDPESLKDELVMAKDEDCGYTTCPECGLPLKTSSIKEEGEYAGTKVYEAITEYYCDCGFGIN